MRTNSMRPGNPLQLLPLLFRANGHNNPRLRLSEENSAWRKVAEVPVSQQDCAANSGRYCTFGQAYGKSAVRAIMCRSKDTFPDCFKHAGMQTPFCIQIDRRRPAGLNIVYKREVFASTQPS